MSNLADASEAEHRFRLLTENVDDVIVIYDRRRQHTFVSPSVQALLGYTPQEACSMAPTELLMPGSASSLDRFLAAQRSYEGAPPASDRLELQYRHKKGGAVWTEVILRSTHDAHGEFAGGIAIIRDITARRRAEERTRASEARYRAIVEDQSELICRYDADGTLSYVNPAYCRFYSLRAEELVGQHFNWPLAPEPNGHDALNGSHLSPASPIVTLEHRVRVGPGEERWLQWTNRAIFDERGYLIEFQAVGRDVTERKRADRELREREALLRAIFDAVSDALFLLDTSGRVVEANERAGRLYGYERSALIGMMGAALLPPDQQGLIAQAERALREVGFFEATSQNRRRDGATFRAEVRATVVTFHKAPHLLFALRELS